MENNGLPSEYSIPCFLTAGETDAEGRMPIWLIVSRVIDAAILHANALGLGYSDLLPLGIGWVLTRLSVEVERYPGINEEYTVTTWIEGYNRLYSDRCFEITDSAGNPVVRARSMWVAMHFDTRTASDLSVIDRSHFVLSQRRSPVGRQRKQLPLGAEAASSAYTFGFSDLDFNRHVNTVQYVRHILNQWPLDRYDACEIARFDIAFHNECHYGDTVDIRHADSDDTPGRSLCEILTPDGRQAVTAAISWRPR